jgi:O-antigen/teichoic acid export membrane protein
VLLVSVPVALRLVNPLIGRVYGLEYIEAAGPLLLLALAAVMYQSVTGWFDFWVVIAEARKANTALYFFFCALTVVAGLSLGGSAIGMARAVAAASLAMTVSAWILFEWRVARLRPPIASVSEP